jgi:hypothetical protein
MPTIIHLLALGLVGLGVARNDFSSARRYSVGKAPGSVECGDFNGDGRPDLAVANEQSGDVSILLNDGKDGFVAAAVSPFGAGHLPNDIAIGDFNRDGKLDLALANHEEKGLTVLLGDGHGAFAAAPNFTFRRASSAAHAWRGRGRR